ncbi:MAG TPA: M20/M25/M40 family metallo-hydrolase [Candidatus Dormibacteraeota bacterium]|nr:M20/M25/M40 family metallo-hydrolase [Candidatus Dormibacteraeota bacterium]
MGELLRDADVETCVLAADPERPNLVARVPGRGDAPPVLLYAHVDVVPATGQRWSRPPFGGELADGCVWGRGAVDMKGGLAAMLAAVLRLREEGDAPAGDVVLAVVADEEAGGRVGARFLVERHRERFAGIRHAIGEDGGAALGMGDTVRFQPIVVAEKRACWLRATLRGPAGHASRAAEPGGAVAKVGRLLQALGPGLIGPHLTPPVDRMLAELQRVLPEPLAASARALRADPGDAPALAALPARDARYLRSVLNHTLNATVLRAGSKTNVVPAEATVELDGRILPGDFDTEGFLAEVTALIGEEAELEILVEGERMPASPMGPFYERLVEVVGELDPEGVAVPMVTTASTDARLLAGLGIGCYGWLPLRTAPGAPYRDLLHAADERVPVDALRLAAESYHRLLLRHP